MTPQGATGSLIPPLTLSLPVNGFNGSHPITVSMTSLTLAVAAVAGIPVNITVGGTGTLPDTAFLTLWLTTQDTAIGSSQINPILPTSGGAGTWNFTNGNSGLWYDPPLVDAYDYTGTGGTLFNSITLPTGFTAPFDVYNGSTFIGSFAGGSAVNFVALTGGAVSSFRVGNINPLADAGSPTAFPLQIFFSTPTGSFTQTGVAAVPEPSTSLALVALAAWGWRRCRRPGTINSIA